MKDAAHIKPDATMYGYYSGMFQAGCSIWKDQGPKGLYAGYWSTLARDVPFAGLMVTCYEALKDVTEYGRQKYNGWMDALRRIWLIEGPKGLFRGSIPRVICCIKICRILSITHAKQNIFSELFHHTRFGS
ncbi:putative mitochondrial carrier domain superfamily [Helianthus anomalus]